jgi:tRNA(fMet)-specific endonuclease VapC
MILLDTDTVTLLAGGHPKVTQRARVCTDQIGTTVVTRIEILRSSYDFLLKAATGEQLSRAQRWLDQSEADLRKLPVVAVDAAAAARFDELRKKTKLRKIGRADLLIACIALANKSTFVTRNLKHFRQVPGLKVENWVD